MNIFSRCCAGFFAGGLLGGALNAAVGAVSSAIGAKILSAAGYAGYSVTTAAQMSVAGNAVLGVLMGGLVGSSRAINLENKEENSTNSKYCSVLIREVGTIVVGGLLGYAMLGGGMELGKVAAASAVGTAVLSGSVTAIRLAIECCRGEEESSPLLDNSLQGVTLEGPKI